MDIPYWKTKEYRSKKAKQWRLDHGVRTVDGLIRICRQCNKEFSPRNINALSCSIECSVAYDKVHRPRPNKSEKFEERLKWNHGLVLAGYRALFDEQKGLCKLCNQPFDESVRELRACLDHDHRCCRIGASCYKCRRGFIHQRCNLLLGHANDSVDLLQKAIVYLEATNAILL